MDRTKSMARDGAAAEVGGSIAAEVKHAPDHRGVVSIREALAQEVEIVCEQSNPGAARAYGSGGPVGRAGR
jgi:hypothetical protein